MEARESDGPIVLGDGKTDHKPRQTAAAAEQGEEGHMDAELATET